MQPEEYALMYQAEETHWWYRALHRLAFDRLRAFSSSTPVVLDIGCGSGGLLQQSTRDFESYGLDIAPEALKACRERRLSMIVQASAQEIPFPTAHFDAAFSMNLLYHQNITIPEKALRETRRVLKPGGILLLNLPAYNWLYSAHDEAVHTARRFTRKSLLELAAAAELELVWFSYWNTLLFPLLAAIRLVHKILPQHGSDLSRASGRKINTCCTGILRIELALLLRHPLPFGLALFAVLRRPLD